MIAQRKGSVALSRSDEDEDEDVCLHDWKRRLP